jgi:Domain of unknown function (DUF4157)/Peptidase_C39 like family
MKRERLRIHRSEEEHRSVFPRPTGQALEPAVKGVLEPRFGHSLANIRIHDDAQADQLTQNADAAAMTVGQDVFFRQGRYEPGSDKGMSLLTHEVAHTVQNRELPSDWGDRTLPSLNQIGRTVQSELPSDWGDRKLPFTFPGDATESGARSATGQVLGGGVAPSLPARSSLSVARLTTDEEAQIPAQAALTKQSWVRSFVGTLDGSIPIHLHLERHGNTLTGFSSGSAERTDDSYNLKGFVTDGAKLVVLEAKDASGKLVRTFHGAFSQEGGQLGFEGSWSATSSDKPPKQLRAVASGSSASGASVVQGPNADDKPTIRWDHPRHFAGTIAGSIPIHLSLQREGNTLSGYSSGTNERGADSFDVSGVISDDAKLVALEAKDATGKTVRTFQGGFSDAKGKKLEGEWVHTSGQGGGKRLSVTEESTAVASGRTQAKAPLAPSAKPEELATKPGDTKGQTPDDLDQLMGFTVATPRYTIDQMHKARELIEKEKDQKSRENLFLLLQTKAEYQNQRDNASIEGGRNIGWKMCNVTSLAMALEVLGIQNPDQKKQFEDALEAYGKKNITGWNRESTGQNGWKGVAESMSTEENDILYDVQVEYVLNPGANASKPRKWWEDTVLSELKSGNSIIMSVKGHIVRLQGIDDSGLIVDDPNGVADLSKYGERSRYGPVTPMYSTNKANDNAANANSKKSSSGDGAKGEDSSWSWASVENHKWFWVAALRLKKSP